jgi:hypothetical protein
MSFIPLRTLVELSACPPHLSDDHHRIRRLSFTAAEPPPRFVSARDYFDEPLLSQSQSRHAPFAQEPQNS